MIVFILIAIALIGLVTAALRSGHEGANIDRETLIVQTSQIQQYASGIEQAVTVILQNGASEADIRFAHPDAPSDYGLVTSTPSFQVFSRTGGAMAYRLPLSGVNNGDPWEFYGHTHLKQAGSDKAELVAVLPNVTAAVCDRINRLNGYAATPADDGGGAGAATCIHGGTALRFGGAAQFSAVPNTTSEASFTVAPVKEGCMSCAGDGSLHFFHVLMSR